MAEAIENAETQETGEKPVFSEEQQSIINEIISKRISEVNAKHAGEIKDLEAKHRKDLELAKMDEESRHKAEEEEKTRALTQRAEAAERQLMVTKVERELAKVGLDSTLAETLLGKDENQTSENIKAVVKAAEALAKKMYAERVGTEGAPKAPTGKDGTVDLRAKMRAAAGLPVGGE
ncbi:MAG: DUF4355 domain-containing protein [Candidatus Methanomethylophilaceae archaeon]|nr:DUF4355 domain-containing protein [Candidatus Methanomethylophilaceae archaeon]